MMDIGAQFDLWRTNLYFDNEIRQELEDLDFNEDEIYDRFYRDLEFGTAGLRGVMGAGTNRMNRYVVRRVSAAIADMINDLDDPKAAKRGVVISYDTRNNSFEFAKEAAAAFAGRGINTKIFENTAPVPVLSYTIIKEHFQAGIMITASHNPKEYNGYKVYWSDGAQISPEMAEEVTERINDIEDFTKVVRFDFDFMLRHGKIAYVPKTVAQSYCRKVAELCVDRDIIAEHGSELAIVYTPLHGSGAFWAPDILRNLGFRKLSTVKEQMRADGNFPTVPVPNPESRAAYDMAIKVAEDKKADVIIATDPDADRMGACIRGEDGEFFTLTGNQIGSLMLNYIIESRKRKNLMPEKPFAVSTIVSTDLAPQIAAANDVEFLQVLTGFKFIGEQVTLKEAKGQKFILGFEESYGYLADSYARDKDGIAAAVMFAEMALYYRVVEKRSIPEVLEEIYRKYGYFYEMQFSLALAGEAGLAKMQELMERLREIKGGIIDEKILSIMDVAAGTEENFETGEVTEIKLPRSNVLKYKLANGWFAVRPSGTEPKVKIYFGFKDNESMQKACEAAERVKAKVVAAAKAIILE